MVKDITLSVIHDYGQVKFEVGEVINTSYNSF